MRKQSTREYQRGIHLDFITPGRPGENNLIESFNGNLRDECLSLHWFESLAEARMEIEARRQEDNGTRPHSSLGNQAPVQYIAELLGVGAGTRGRRVTCSPKTGPGIR